MKNWTRKKMSDLVDGLEAGVSVRSSSGLAHKFILKTSSVEGGRFLPEESKSILQTDLHRARCSPVANSMIISRMNTPALVGDVGYVAKTYPELFLPDRLWIARPKRGSATDMRWLTYYFASKPGKEQLQALATGTSGSMKNIAKAQVLDLELCVPDTREQRMISEALSSIDALIMGLERLVVKKQSVKQGMMQQLLTGRTRLPGFEDEWVDLPLGEIARLRSGRPKQQSPGGPNWIVDMGSVTREGELVVTKRTLSFDDFLKPGELIMPKDDIGGGHIIGRTALIDLPDTYILADHVYAITPLGIDSAFLNFAINSHPVNTSLRSKATGSAQLGLSVGNVSSQAIYMPSSRIEQESIAGIITDVVDEIDLLRERLEKARSVKAGMMQQLLTGRVRLPVEVGV